MLVDAVFPFDSLGCQDWSHEIIDSGYKPQTHLRRGKPTSSMVDDEEHGVGRRFPSAIEAVKSVFVEEDIDKECRNVPFDVDIGDAPSKNVLFAGGQSVRREFESPTEAFRWCDQGYCRVWWYFPSAILVYSIYQNKSLIRTRMMRVK